MEYMDNVAVLINYAQQYKTMFPCNPFQDYNFIQKKKQS